MTKGEFTNNLIYDMAGYLDAEGTERLKMALAYRMKGFHLVPDETLPATDVRDNEWILGRYHVDLIAVGRKEKQSKCICICLKSFLKKQGYTTPL